MGVCYSANDDLIRAALAPAANFGTECAAFPVESPRGATPSTDQDAERRRPEPLEVAWKRDRRVDIWQRFASPGSSLCKKPRLLGLPRVVHPISVIRTMQSFQCGTLMRDRGCAPAERRDGNRMRAENGAAPNRSARPARWLQLRSPLSDCLRLKTGENTCTLEREACRRAADPFAGFPLHFVGMRALEVATEKASAGEIVEGARSSPWPAELRARRSSGPCHGEKGSTTFAPPARLGISWSRCKLLRVEKSLRLSSVGETTRSRQPIRRGRSLLNREESRSYDSEYRMARIFRSYAEAEKGAAPAAATQLGPRI